MLLWKIFVLYSRVSLFSWGGGPASLALMQRETTTAMWLPPGAAEPVPWATPLEFSDAVALGNAPHDDEFVQLHVRHVPGGAHNEAGFVGDMQAQGLSP